MSFIGLLRHGETAGGSVYQGWTDVPLTTKGWQQMRKSTARLTKWDQIISSPLQRCRCFAREFAKAHAIPYFEDTRLRELNFGQWEGCSAKQIMSTSPESLQNFWRDPVAHPPPGGETLGHFQSRVVEAWKRLSIDFPQQKILLITHGGVIRILLCHLQQRDLNQLFDIEVKHENRQTDNSPTPPSHRIAVPHPAADLIESSPTKWREWSRLALLPTGWATDWRNVIRLGRAA
ncbi:MAG: alpha-ribazole phosphatase [Candidatus Thiodiazotropha sp.]